MQIAQNLSLPRFSIENYISSYCNVKTNTGKWAQCLTVGSRNLDKAFRKLLVFSEYVASAVRASVGTKMDGTWLSNLSSISLIRLPRRYDLSGMPNVWWVCHAILCTYIHDIPFFDIALYKVVGRVPNFYSFFSIPGSGTFADLGIRESQNSKHCLKIV